MGQAGIDQYFLFHLESQDDGDRDCALLGFDILEIIRMCLGRPVIVTPQDGTFTPRFEDIERAVTSYTRAIIVNSPNNPSGANLYPPALIEKLVDFCERKGIFLICDDIYHRLTFDHKEAIPAIRLQKRMSKVRM